MRDPHPGQGAGSPVPGGFFVSVHEPSDATPDIRTLGFADAAQALGLPERTLRHMVSTRRIPYVKFGRLLRFRPADIETFLRANTRPVIDPHS